MTSFYFNIVLQLRENVHKYDFSAEQWKYAYRLHIQANEEIS